MQIIPDRSGAGDVEFQEGPGMWHIVSGLCANRDTDPQILLLVRHVVVHSYKVARDVLKQCLVVDKMNTNWRLEDRHFGINGIVEKRFDDIELGITFVYCLLPLQNAIKMTLLTKPATQVQWTVGAGRDEELVCIHAGVDCDIIDCSKCI